MSLRRRHRLELHRAARRAQAFGDLLLLLERRMTGGPGLAAPIVFLALGMKKSLLDVTEPLKLPGARAPVWSVICCAAWRRLTPPVVTCCLSAMRQTRLATCWQTGNQPSPQNVAGVSRHCYPPRRHPGRQPHRRDPHPRVPHGAPRREHHDQGQAARRGRALRSHDRGGQGRRRSPDSSARA